MSIYQYDAPIVYDAEQQYDAYAPAVVPVVVPVLPHLSVSFQLNPDGSFAFWQQGTLDEVSQSVEVICGTTKGQRTVVPTFGLPDVVFTEPSAGIIQNIIQQWEPRCQPQVTAVTNADGTADISVGVSLIKGANG